MMTIDEAILTMRRDPSKRELVHESYLDEDVKECGERFVSGAEFAETWRLVCSRARNGVVLDIGAGRGIASYAFARAGASKVLALEPDPSCIVGRGALRELCNGLGVDILECPAEDLELPSETIDVVYARQVLHHIRNLPAALKHIARVLKPGGIFLAAREHVADTPEELAVFLRNHELHRLVGGEHAWPLQTYRIAILDSGLVLRNQFGPLENIINTTPLFRTAEELRHYPRVLLRRRFGQLGELASRVPGVEALIKLRTRLLKPHPGRAYTFLAVKPYAERGGEQSSTPQTTAV